MFACEARVTVVGSAGRLCRLLFWHYSELVLCRMRSFKLLIPIILTLTCGVPRHFYGFSLPSRLYTLILAFHFTVFPCYLILGLSALFDIFHILVCIRLYLSLPTVFHVISLHFFAFSPLSVHILVCTRLFFISISMSTFLRFSALFHLFSTYILVFTRVSIFLFFTLVHCICTFFNLLFVLFSSLAYSYVYILCSASFTSIRLPPATVRMISPNDCG